MQKVRNAVIIIVLCIVGAYKTYKPIAPRLGLPPADFIHDAVSGDRVNASRPSLNLPSGDDDQFRDSVAGNAIPGFHQNAPQGDVPNVAPPAPRGGGNGGFGPFSGPNPVSQIPPAGPSPLSPSGPRQ